MPPPIGVETIHVVCEKLAKTVNVVNVEAAKIRAGLIQTLKNLKNNQLVDISAHAAFFHYQEYAWKQLFELIKNVSMMAIFMDEDYMRKERKRKRDKENKAARKLRKLELEEQNVDEMFETSSANGGNGNSGSNASNLVEVPIFDIEQLLGYADGNNNIPDFF
jgi:hypothetical protein